MAENCVLYVNVVIVFFLRLVKSVPDEYCLKGFNSSNCGLEKAPVFNYYKPGSRCVVAYWRGCPTANMFATVYQCHHHCIGKLIDSSITEGLLSPLKSEKKGKISENCDVELDTNKCSSVKELVFTYDKKQQACVKRPYYGCKTGNKFSERFLCEKTCIGKDWTSTVQDVSINDLEKVNHVDEVEEPEYAESPENPQPEESEELDELKVTDNRPKKLSFKMKITTESPTSDVPDKEEEGDGATEGEDTPEPENINAPSFLHDSGEIMKLRKKKILRNHLRKSQH